MCLTRLLTSDPAKEVIRAESSTADSLPINCTGNQGQQLRPPKELHWGSPSFRRQSPATQLPPSVPNSFHNSICN